ncbi:MAG TPA: BON domain-containing protein [Bryobacteraceae bacterium]|jgi:hyperosmotically inducible protein|nr:BON domain-containing protein [Bryobacteraceae bacterium]
MRTKTLPALVLLLPGGLLAAEVSVFRAYVDSDLCARLMLGPITASRIECSRSTVKDGSEPVVVHLHNNLVLAVNKQKMIRPLAGQLVEASGEIKANNGTVKLQSASVITAESVPQGDPARKLLDVHTYRTDKSAQLHEKIRHELAMMPYISEFDFISFTQSGSDVILTGWTVRTTNRSTAYNVVKDIDGVETVINNIEVLPLGSLDMQIRAAARAALQRQLSRYFWGNGSDIKIIVKDGQIILLGTVATKADSDVAFIQCNSVSGAFKVFNMLRVQASEKKGA